jgi:hypothetical protein
MQKGRHWVLVVRYDKQEHITFAHTCFRSSFWAMLYVAYLVCLSLMQLNAAAGCE